MQNYKKKFDEIYQKKQSIKIRIFDENPLTKKYVRFNQGGTVCHCMEGSNIAKQKVKDGYKNIECNLSTCQYRQKNEQGKSACNRIAWLKFLMPEISTDRIFLMRITGQTSIDRLDEYFNFQKLQGNSIKNDYTLYLKQEEQTNIFAKSFNNYVLDILNDSEFKKLDNSLTSEIEIQNTSKTASVEDKNVENQEKSSALQNISKTSKITTKEEIKTKKASDTKTTKSTISVKKDTKSKVTKESDNSAKTTQSIQPYALLSTHNGKIFDKDYLIGEFSDMNDKISEIAIHPNYASEIINCDLGTMVNLEVSEIRGKKFATKLDFIEKVLKKEVA